MSDSIHVILPQRDDNAVANSLRRLTQRIHKLGLADAGGYGLGGEFGYGVNFENEVFMMHRYCWCESADCPWCAGCTCSQRLWSYWLDGKRVTFKEQHRFIDRWYYGPGGFKAWLKRGGAVATPHGTKEYKLQAARTETRKDQDRSKWCRVCRGEFGREPHFRHKPSGSTVSWYKWIGRDMECSLKAEWHTIIRDCTDSLRKASQ